MAVWHAGNTISNIISGFLAAGILYEMGDVAGVHSWQWFFIVSFTDSTDRRQSLANNVIVDRRRSQHSGRCRCLLPSS
jgi:hypothetical protein